MYVAAGKSVSFAVTEDSLIGLCLGHDVLSTAYHGSGREDDQWAPNEVPEKQLKG